MRGTNNTIQIAMILHKRHSPGVKEVCIFYTHTHIPFRRILWYK